MNQQELGVLIPILVPISMFAMVFGIVYLSSRERMAMIERGMNPREHRAQAAPAPFKYLKWALLLIGAGLGLFLANLLDHTVMASMNNKGENPAIYFSLIAIFGGIGLFISYLIEKRETIDKRIN